MSAAGADLAELTVPGGLGPEEVHEGSAHRLPARGDAHKMKPTDLPALLSRLHGSHQQMDENQMSCTVLICCSCCAVGTTLSWETESRGGGPAASIGWC